MSTTADYFGRRAMFSFWARALPPITQSEAPDAAAHRDVEIPPRHGGGAGPFPHWLAGALRGHPGAAPGTGRRRTELNLPAISRQRKPLQRTEYGKAPYSNPRAGPAFVSNPPSSGAPILADKDAAIDPSFTFLRPLSGRSVYGHSQPGTIFFSSIKEK